MTALVYLIPVALLFGLGSLAAFLWALKNGQYDDLDGASARILIDRDSDGPPSHR
ncbi:MAG: cbb3-type cytochrome oxidase assembly protein CcoS [Rhizobiales bacterium]|nr:cbb3-type cytochrome oxidase assembly protein CcoS [Hyphomicrobiales bacterium]